MPQKFRLPNQLRADLRNLLLLRSKLYPLLILLAIIVVVYFAVFRIRFFAVKHISCSNKNGSTISDTGRWCDFLKRDLLGSQLYNVKTKDSEENLKKLYLPVEKIEFKKSWPSTLEAIFYERQPAAKVSPPDGLFYLLDKNGLVFSQAVEGFSDLPEIIIQTTGEITTGSTLDHQIIDLISIKDPKILSLTISDQGYYDAKLVGNVSVRFSRSKDIREQVEALQTVYKKYTIEGKVVRRVDLRFNNPVVEY